MQATVTSEDQLILLLARGELSPHVQEEAFALLSKPLRWDLILERAAEHEVYPLLYRNLRRLGFPGVPSQVSFALERLYKANAFRNSLLAEELAQVLKLLAGAGIPTIPLKGVTLAESLYGDLTLRVCADIDILVPRRLVAQAFHLLVAGGYRAEFTERFFEDCLLRSHIEEYALLREDRCVRYLLELHWGILWGAQWNEDATEDFWGEARPKAFFGVPAYTLSPEWELLFLAAHAARHQWQGLKWLVDIHEVCSRDEIEWDTVREKAKRLGWEELLRITLGACHALLDTPIPARFPLRMLPPWVTLFPNDPSPQSWHSVFLPLRLLTRPSDRLCYLLRGLLVPTLADRQLFRLPSSLVLLYYPLHLLRVGCKWSWRLVSVVSRRFRSTAPPSPSTRRTRS